MKNRFSAFSKICAYSAVYLIILLLAVFNGFRINTSFYSLFPSSENIGKVDDKILQNTSPAVNILVGHEDFAVAAEQASRFYDIFKDSGIFSTLVLYTDDPGISELQEYLFDHRYMLLDNDLINDLENGDVGHVSDSALAAVYGAFTFTDLSLLAEDPFMLTEHSMKRFVSGISGNLQFRQNMLTGESGGKKYILIRGKVSDSALAFSGQNGLARLYDKASELNRLSGAEFMFSGVPFHSYESSRNASHEIFWISILSIAGVVILLIFAFHSILPVFVSVVNILVSLLFAIASVVVFFGNIHILAFVFGTTLIGISIDYSIHYFIASGYRHNFRGLIINCISTEISWLFLMLAPFTLLRQIALFSAVGLLCSFIGVYWFYPLLNISCRRMESVRTAALSRKNAGIALLCMSMILVTVSLGAGIRIKNDLTGMYRMSDFLQKSERTVAEVLDFHSGGEYIIVSGTSEQELLEKEEALCTVLMDEKKAGNIGGFTAISQYIPSVRTQMKSYAAASALISESSVQFCKLGFSPDEMSSKLAADYRSGSSDFIVLDSDVPAFFHEICDNLYLGNIDGKFFSVVFPTKVKNPALLKERISDLDNVIFCSKVNDISGKLDSLTRMTLIFIAFSYICILAILFCIYRKKALILAAVPAVIILTLLALVTFANGGVDFFSAAGIILVFGLGLDYLVYSAEGAVSGIPDVTSKATLFSFITTELSFGALAFSSFQPVHIFGITVAAGLGIAYLFSVFTARIYSDKI